MYAGVSESFSDLIKLQKYYSQSITAIEFGTKLNHSVRTFFYYDYAFYHMAELILRNHTLNDFCHPLIIQLLESKDERDFELLKTLYVWFRSGKNAAIVSQVLGIHRSTFFYRLNKFKERLDENPEDGETLFHLMFSFELIYFAAIQNSDQKLAWIRELPAFQTGQGAN